MHGHMSRCSVTCHDARSHVTMHGHMNVKFCRIQNFRPFCESRQTRRPDPQKICREWHDHSQNNINSKHSFSWLLIGYTKLTGCCFVTTDSVLTTRGVRIFAAASIFLPRRSCIRRHLAGSRNHGRTYNSSCRVRNGFLQSHKLTFVVWCRRLWSMVPKIWYNLLLLFSGRE